MARRHEPNTSNIRLIHDSALCPVFREKLVYFFCGTVARRASDTSLPWGRSESPVVLVFKPSLLESIVRYFPLDTGALAAGRLGEDVSDFRASLKIDMPANPDPWRFISSVYGTTERYLRGEPLSTRNFKLPAPIASVTVRHSWRLTAQETQEILVSQLHPVSSQALAGVWEPRRAF